MVVVTVGVAEDKAALRVKLLAKRAALAGSLAKTGYRFAAMARVLPIAPLAIVAGYIPLRGEVDVLPFLRGLADKGHVLAMPVVVDRNSPLIFRQWQPGDALEDGPFQTRQPLANAALLDPSMFLVPLLGFDRRGNRLGFGGGFYDRTLRAAKAKRAIIAMGMAYRAQEVPHIPVEPHDARLDFIVTETEVIRCWV